MNTPENAYLNIGKIHKAGPTDKEGIVRGWRKEAPIARSSNGETTLTVQYTYGEFSTAMYSVADYK